jgi:hemerythrin
MDDLVHPAARAAAYPVLTYADWSDRLEIGVPLIDEQHKRFFDLAASLNSGMNEIRVMKTLVTLSDYIRSHLREEEALMAAVSYPRLREHRQLHAQFRQMLGDLLERARKMSMDEIADEVRLLINGWFYQHIITEDFAYAPYLVPDKHLERRAALPVGRAQAR